MTFTKLFSSILESTIWCESDSTRIVWITMLAIADRYGAVHASIPGLANRAGVSVENCEAALQRFQEPDKYSRTPDYDGRRIEPMDGGWRLLNYSKYRELGHPRASSDSEGYVYYAGVPGGTKIKIGFSKNPWARINDLRVTNPRLEILATEKAVMEREKERHVEFKSHRLGGEWFSTSESLLSLVRALADRDTRSKATTTVVRGNTTVATEAEAEVEADSTSKEKPKVAAVPLPAWLDPETWGAYVKTRPSAARKPESLKAAIAKLDAFRAEGFNPNEIVANSLANGWRMLKPPERVNGHGKALQAKAQPCGNCGSPLISGWSQSPKGRVCDACHRGYMGSGWPEKRVAA